MLAPPQRQTVGDFVGLCLLVDFSELPPLLPAMKSNASATRPGTQGLVILRVRFDFFLENSFCCCRYTNIVAPYYRALHPKTYYTDRTIPQPQRANQ